MTLVNKKGVDISYAQDDVDLSKVKASGYSWVMIRVGQGTRITDNWFATNVQKAEKLGMPWGVYLLTEATNTAAAQAEVDFADRLIKAQIAKGYKPTLPIAIDIEESGFKSGNYTPSILTNTARVWVEGMRSHGYYPMIYTGYYDIRDYLAKDVVKSCDIWLAEWGRYPDYKESNLGMWQFSDGNTDLVEFKPLIPGVGVAVDKNICYKDYPTIIKSGGYNGWKKDSASDSKPKGVTAQDVIKTAYSLIGKDENRAKCDIMAWYGDFDDGVNEEACCCAGQMYLFNKANALSLISGGKTANCGTLALNFYEAGQLHKPGEVKVGDLVTFSWSGDTTSVSPLNTLGYKTFDHVELCVEVGSTTIKCIGANNGGDECDDFQLKTRNRSNISGCCRPKYGDDGSSDSAISAPVSSDATGDSGIKSVQAWLNNNFSSGLSVDGVFGPLTNAALVRALQTVLNREYGANLDVDGVFGPMTKKSIKCIEKGAQGDYVRVLQGFLICHGLDTGGFDGDFGYMTKSAVLTFQTTANIDADGIAGPNTFDRLANGF